MKEIIKAAQKRKAEQNLNRHHRQIANTLKTEAESLRFLANQIEEYSNRIKDEDVRMVPTLVQHAMKELTRRENSSVIQRIMQSTIELCEGKD